MRSHFFVASILAALAQGQDTCTPRVTSLRVNSFNIRWAAPPSGLEKAWSERGPLVISQLADSISAAPQGAIPIIGMQEVIVNQLQDIKTGLGADWAHIGIGRDDGVEAGEFSPILYQPAELRLLNFTNKWLSPTPEVPSPGWGANVIRIVTVGVFEVLKGPSAGRKFVAANTHLDHQSSLARANGVRLALDVIRAVRADHAPGSFVSFTGDFNSGEGQDAYQAILDDGFLAETYHLAKPEQRFGPVDATFTGFSPDPSKLSRIDFVWLGPKEKKWALDRHEVVDNIVNGTYASDHRLVIADVRILG